MSRERSPNYPSVDLASAVNMVKALFQREGRSAVAPQIAIKAWGLGSLHGPARSKIGALKAYGLLVGDKDKVRVSDRALTLILMSPETTDHQSAVREAALDPAIFQELYETNPEASDDALRHFLVVQKKFTDEGARRLIETFRATIALAGLSGVSRPESDGASGQPEGGVISPRVVLQPSVPRVIAAEPKSQQVYRWPLAKEVSAEVILTGPGIQARHLERLRQYLALAMDALESDDPAEDVAADS